MHSLCVYRSTGSKEKKSKRNGQGWSEGEKQRVIVKNEIRIVKRVYVYCCVTEVKFYMRRNLQFSVTYFITNVIFSSLCDTSRND